MVAIVTYTTTDISLARLVPSPANVRRTGAGAGIEALAASIAAHGLLQSLVVRPKLDGEGQPTEHYEVVAGGRRLAALKLLARQKRIAKSALIPCRVRDGEEAEAAEASLAENVVRVDMHPADQFEAFQALHESGAGIEDIAVRFGVSAHTVRQRLRLASVSPALIQAYRDEQLTLDHLTAFAVTEDREAQKRVFAQLRDWQCDPDAIRRLLTHALVPATDRKAAFVGLAAYTAAGGTVQRDLFSEDDGGWIADSELLERLVAERMEREAEAIRTEGWRWVTVGLNAQSAAWGMRRVWPDRVALSDEDAARRAELASRYDELAEQHDSGDDLPEDVAADLDRIDAELAALERREETWRPEDMAIAGVVLSIAADGTLRAERGYVRPEDEPASEPITSEQGEAAESGNDAGEEPAGPPDKDSTVTPLRPVSKPEDKSRALSAVLLAELEAHRTAGLQAAIVGNPELALRVMLHGLATDAFYIRYGETVASFHSYPPALAGACPDIADSPARQAMMQAEDAWRSRLPREHTELWGWLQDQEAMTLLELLAVCVARTANAGSRNWTTPEGGQCVAAQVARGAGLDMRAHWTATKDSYLGRVSKALIIEAVREGAGATAAGQIAGGKKEIMVADAAQVLAGTGWLPALLRVPEAAYPVDSGDADTLSVPPMPAAAE